MSADRHASSSSIDIDTRVAGIRSDHPDWLCARAAPPAAGASPTCRN
jgi:hypothetical protein